VLGGRSNCPICGHDFRSDISEGVRLVHTSPSRMFMAPHLQENHADYLAWKKSKFKPSIVAGIATGIIFDFLLALVLYNSGIQLPHGRAGAWPFLVVLFSALPVPWLLLNQWGLRRFRREWNERGGLPASHLPVSTSNSKDNVGYEQDTQSKCRSTLLSPRVAVVLLVLLIC
jgi:hypothetical protein